MTLHSSLFLSILVKIIIIILTRSVKKTTTRRKTKLDVHQSAYNKLLLAYYHRTTRKKYADARADYEGMALVFHAVILILSSLRKNEITILLCLCATSAAVIT